MFVCIYFQMCIRDSNYPGPQTANIYHIRAQRTDQYHREDDDPRPSQINRVRDMPSGINPRSKTHTNRNRGSNQNTGNENWVPVCVNRGFTILHNQPESGHSQRRNGNKTHTQSGGRQDDEEEDFNPDRWNA